MDYPWLFIGNISWNGTLNIIRNSDFWAKNHDALRNVYWDVKRFNSSLDTQINESYPRGSKIFVLLKVNCSQSQKFIITFWRNILSSNVRVVTFPYCYNGFNRMNGNSTLVMIDQPTKLIVNSTKVQKT